MKKSIIAAGAASVALAAMPIMGAFAGTTSVDNITASIDDGCTVTDAVTSKDVSLTVSPGSVNQSTAADSITVLCNNNNWKITAVGSTDVPSGYSAGTTTDLIATHTGDTTTYDRIATGTAVSGATSNWAFKVVNVTAASGVTPSSTYTTDYQPVPSSAADIVTATAAARVTVGTQYQVFAAVGQAAGSYKGAVTYTVVKN